MKTAKDVDQKLVQLTVLGLREKLMEYFKGTCVQRRTRRDHISLMRSDSVGHNGRAYRYERQNEEVHKPRRLALVDVPLAEVSLAPDQIIFYTNVMKRSPEFTAVYNELRHFFKRYLQGVQVKENDKDFGSLKEDTSRDKDIISATGVMSLDNNHDGSVVSMLSYNRAFYENESTFTIDGIVWDERF